MSFMRFMVDRFCFFINYLCSSVSRMSFFVSFVRFAVRGCFLFFIVVPAAPSFLSVFALHEVFYEAGHRQV